MSTCKAEAKGVEGSLSGSVARAVSRGVYRGGSSSELASLSCDTAIAAERFETGSSVLWVYLLSPNEKSADGQPRLDGGIAQTDEPSLLRFDGRSGSVISTRGDVLMYFVAGSIRTNAYDYLYGSSSLLHRKGKLAKRSCRVQFTKVLSPKPREATRRDAVLHARLPFLISYIDVRKERT